MSEARDSRYSFIELFEHNPQEVIMKNSLVVMMLFLVAGAAFAGEQLKILPPCEKGKPRIQVPPDRVWPEKAGEGDICLWSMDRFAACAITIDDNCQPDHAWWMKLTDELGIKVTWFVITDGVVKNGTRGGTFPGCWKEWQKLADAGHSIQSHTTNHSSATNHPPEVIAHMYGDSLKVINENITNNFACTIAYPCGVAYQEEIGKYAIGGRGVYGVPSSAGSINYRCTNKGAGGKGHVQMVAFGETEEGPKWVQGMKGLKRGFNIVLYHFVHAGRTPEEKEKNAANAEAEVRYIASLKDDRLWVCRFDDVMKYGQERDTAKLVVKSASADKFVFDLSDDMDDKLFDFPLTIKFRLPDGWKSVKASQGGKEIKAEFVEHDGAPYALVYAVPDRGETTVEK